MNPSFDASVERARLGDRRAFGDVVETMIDPLVRFAVTVMRGDVHAAHDVVQETFLEAWRQLPDLEEPQFLRAWLYRVAHRRAITWLRRRGPKGTPFLAMDDPRVEQGDALVGPRGPDPDGLLEGDGIAADSKRNGAAPRLHAAMGSLPEIYLAPLTLFYFEGLCMRETARVLAVSVPTLKMRLFRGRTMLRRRLLSKEPWTPHRSRRRKAPPPRPPIDSGAAPPSAHVAESSRDLASRDLDSRESGSQESRPLTAPREPGGVRAPTDPVRGETAAGSSDGEARAPEKDSNPKRKRRNLP